jgi:hypothetical protein
MDCLGTQKQEQENVKTQYTATTAMSLQHPLLAKTNMVLIVKINGLASSPLSQSSYKKVNLELSNHKPIIDTTPNINLPKYFPFYCC